jgi:hypothetical protein
MPQLAILDSKAINSVEKSTLSDAVCEIKLWLLQIRLSVTASLQKQHGKAIGGMNDENHGHFGWIKIC